MPRQLQPCGTEGAYQRHQRNGEPFDDACLREMARVRQVRYAARREACKARSRLRNRAMAQLAREYPARFLEIHDALKAIAQTAPDRKDST